MNKQEFKEKVKQLIIRVNGRIEELELLLLDTKNHMQWEYEEEIENLKMSKASLESKYRTLSETAEDKWEKTKEDFIGAINVLKSKINRTLD